MYKPSTIPFDSLNVYDAIYISAPMSGIEDMNRKELDYAETVIRGKGHTNILNPYYLVDQSKEITWGECLYADFIHIFERRVKAVVLLDGWKDSKGANLEIINFLALGIPIFSLGGINIYSEVFHHYSPDNLYDVFCKMVATHKI